MSSTDAEHTAFVSDYGATELRNIKFIIQSHFMGSHFVNIEKVDILCSPFEVVDKLTRTVALFQNKGIVK
jgi:hypothetical protein